MGNFRVVVEAVGGHGCQRERGDGETVTGCGLQHCPDCAAREFVLRLTEMAVTVDKAEIVHWPADMPGYSADSEVRDDLLTGRRTGEFSERARYLADAGNAADAAE